LINLQMPRLGSRRSSYLVDPAQESRHLAEIADMRGYPVITAAQAVLDALAALNARRIGLISPYGGGLHNKGVEYWTGQGLELAHVAQITSDDAAFHPIYAQLGGAPVRAVKDVLDHQPEAIVILGTGLPSLPAILEYAAQPVPVLSPNLCLMWRCVTVLKGDQPSRENLMPWLTAAQWRARYANRMHDEA
jgi:maleate cis-trans isomerase